jgi:hypothetical protein
MKYALILFITSSGSTNPLENSPTVLYVGNSNALPPWAAAINPVLAAGTVQSLGVQWGGQAANLSLGMVRVDGTPVVGGSLNPESGVYTPAA